MRELALCLELQLSGLKRNKSIPFIKLVTFSLSRYLPYKGAREEGVAGFFKGLGVGVASAGAAPLIGVGVGATQIIRGVSCRYVERSYSNLLRHVGCQHS